MSEPVRCPYCNHDKVEYIGQFGKWTEHICALCRRLFMVTQDGHVLMEGD